MKSKQEWEQTCKDCESARKEGNIPQCVLDYLEGLEEIIEDLTRENND